MVTTAVPVANAGTEACAVKLPLEPVTVTVGTRLMLSAKAVTCRLVEPSGPTSTVKFTGTLVLTRLLTMLCGGIIETTGGRPAVITIWKLLVAVDVPSDAVTVTRVVPTEPAGVNVSFSAPALPVTATEPRLGVELVAATVILLSAVSTSATVKFTVKGTFAGVV